MTRETTKVVLDQDLYEQDLIGPEHIEGYIKQMGPRRHWLARNGDLYREVYIDDPLKRFAIVGATFYIYHLGGKAWQACIANPIPIEEGLTEEQVVEIPRGLIEALERA